MSVESLKIKQRLQRIVRARAGAGIRGGAMTLNEAVSTLEVLAATPEQLEALATLYALAIERDDALKQAEELNGKLVKIKSMVMEIQE